ncbi:response regulator [Chryseolinea sp. T2]|uniref:response regulator n=1 Tax=Chryseolinea sp. T2 TaxID=3129255 RepID=UPI003078264E
MKTILIADDSASIRELVEMTLRSAGYDVLKSSDGEHAIQHLDGTPIDLVITDLNMPKVCGIELLREIRSRADYATVPVLLLTTESQAAKKEEAKAAGATGWIVKPFVPEKLLSVVHKVIR